MDLGLKDATVVVAGGTTGMGRAAADCFAADGAKVAVLARSREQLDETAAALEDLGSPDAIGLQVDLFDGDSVDAAMAEIGDRWGFLNALVNAAGPLAGDLKSFETYTDEDWLGVFDGLTLSSVRTIRAALPLLRSADWARIVNVSAMSTKHQSPPLVAYTAAKSALTSLTKNLSQSLAADGILVNTVSPGTFASESFKAALAPIPDLDENDLHDIMRFISDNFGHHVFLNRAAAPAEIGPVIAFAASARNTYMTGANINVDGGSDFT
jgi:3-oxoacyl-[acyl-carrier protein] reductase